jgi:hypothetical protein
MGEGSSVRMKVHSGPMGSLERSRRASPDHRARLATACGELEAVLESIDLAEDPDLADALVEAVTATTRAHDLAVTAEGAGVDGTQGTTTDGEN